jgi:hypothetical protein
MSVGYIATCRKLCVAFVPVGRCIQGAATEQADHLQHIVADGFEVVHMARHEFLRSLELLVQHICRQPCIIPKLLLQADVAPDLELADGSEPCGWTHHASSLSSVCLYASPAASLQVGDSL